jgi:two-component system nitrate/nitrite response regulator NarL
MNAAAEPALAPAVRVLVCAADPLRRDALVDLVRHAGHRLVETIEAADVVVCDGDCPANVMSKPVVALGGPEADQAGWLPRDCAANQIDAALAAVAAGLTVRIAETQAGFAAMEEHAPDVLLTPREMEVLTAIADGLTNKMIARRLEISLHTVKFHVESVFRKLGVRTRTEAVARALERRIRNTLVL